MSFARVPSATYRIQFHLAFRFVNARELVPYLHDLGISDLYASPRFKARRGSSHGYDVADPLRINSELGTDKEFEELEQRLKNYSMGLLLDIVPNHMATSADNPWWMDVLENGPSSEFADYFDIDWHPSTTKAAFLQENKVLIPILGDLYGNVLENQDFALKLDETGFYVRYGGTKLPLDPKTYGTILESCLECLAASVGSTHPAFEELRKLIQEIGELPGRTETEPESVKLRRASKNRIKGRLWTLYHEQEVVRQCFNQTLTQLNGTKGDARSFDRLNELLSDQAYRVSFWKLAAEEINYRRFFDINDLIGLRVEDPKVLEARHALIFRLIHEKKVSGLRIDHIDGLHDPQAYLQEIQARAKESDESLSDSANLYIVVEKILAENETLPGNWPVAGTTGYDFLNALNGVFVDESGLQKLGETYERFIGSTSDFDEVVYQGKKKVLAELFAGEMIALAHELGEFAAPDRYARDVPLSEYHQALIEVTACLPVYRTYVRDLTLGDSDRAYLERALEEAQRRTVEERAGPPAFAFLRRVLLLDVPGHAPERGEPWLRFVMRWQQFTGAAMAKGFEDTALYVYNRLTSMNEVGGHPGGSALSVEGFHEFLRARLEQTPLTLNATSTHDTKRSEDVRARLDVLSELPEEWGKILKRWSKWNRPHKPLVDGQPAPDRNDEALIYQTLLGAWPLQDEELALFQERLKEYLIKAAREAKVHTSWIRPNPEYETALAYFTDEILNFQRGARFLRSFASFHKTLAHFGALNSLSQVLLKVSSPGVPDFYQGTELWDFSLADPDNRRPVDFHLRQRQLEDLRKIEPGGLLGLASELLAHWQDGRVKLFTTYKALNFRQANRDLFQQGDYLPLEVTGSRRKNACTFARHQGNDWAITVVPHRVTQLADLPEFPLGRKVWGKGTILLPSHAPDRWRNVFTHQLLSVDSKTGKKALSLGQIFRDFPVALLRPAKSSS
jgi:(1->4)-alpha-D-glucan 1-alpha-D-glucosylmutase